MSKDSFSHRSELADRLDEGIGEIKTEIAKIGVVLPRLELDVRKIEDAAIANRSDIQDLKLLIAEIRRQTPLPPDPRRVLARDSAIVTVGGGLGGLIVKLIELMGG